MIIRPTTRLLLALGLALFAASPCIAEGSPPDPLGPAVRQAMERQDQLVDGGDTDQLLTEARKRVSDGEASSWYLLGRALGNCAILARQGGDSEGYLDLLGEAREAFDKAREVGGLLYAPAHLGLARCARFDEDLDEAVRELRRALQIEPGFKAAVLEQAEVLWQQGIYPDAEHTLVKFLQEYPDDVQARLLLGGLKTSRKRWGEAEAEFRRVVLLEPGNLSARKALATTLMFQKEYKESAEHFERVLLEEPEADDVYITLFQIYREQKDLAAAKSALSRLVKACPGSPQAAQASKTLDELAAAPEIFEEPRKDPRQTLVERLQSPKEEVVADALQEMLKFEWNALPPQVYRLLSPDIATASVRRLAVRLIGNLEDERTLPLLEIMLFHPTERDKDIGVRREVAHAISRIPSPATVPIQYMAVQDRETDTEIREWAVQGIAARTGKYFRNELEVPANAAEWPKEREAYARWWATPTASVAKREAMAAMTALFARTKNGRIRLARYALQGMRDSNERTWKAGYELFRALTSTTFGADEGGFVEPAQRQRVTREAEAWLAQELAKPR